MVHLQYINVIHNHWRAQIFFVFLRVMLQCFSYSEFMEGWKSGITWNSAKQYLLFTILKYVTLKSRWLNKWTQQYLHNNLTVDRWGNFPFVANKMLFRVHLRSQVFFILRQEKKTLLYWLYCHSQLHSKSVQLFLSY